MEAWPEGWCRFPWVLIGTEKLAEEALVRTQNPYASTKLTIDLMLAGECPAFGLGAASLRYFNAAGAAGAAR